MASFTGQLIKDTYDGIIKTIDNGVVDSTAKNLTDGVGNLTPFWVSTTQLGVGVTPSTDFHVNGSALIGGSLTITGDLTVNGTTTTISTQTLSVEDPLIILAKDNAANSVDIGFYGKYVDGSTKYAGFFRKAGDNKFHIFSGLGAEPTTTVNTGDASYVVSTLVGNLEGNVTGNLIATGAGATQIASDVRAVTQAAADSSTKVATTAFVQQELTGSDLDFSGTSGTGSVDLDSQVFAVVGTANEIETTAGSQQLQIGMPNDVTIGNDLTVSNDLDVTGVITTAGVTEQATQFLFTKDLKVHDSLPVITLSDSDSSGASSTGDIIWIDSGSTQKAIISLTSSNLGITSKAGALNFGTNSTNALTIDTSQDSVFQGTITTGGGSGSGGALTVWGGYAQNLNQSGGTVTAWNLTNSATASGTSDTTQMQISQKDTGGSAIDLKIGQSADGKAFFGSKTVGIKITNASGNTEITGSLAIGGNATAIASWVTESQGIASNDNDTTVPTSAAVKDYVDTNVTAQDLDFSGTSGTGSVDLDSQTFAVVGTANEIETSASSQTLTIGLPSDVTIGNDLTVTGTITGTTATFAGDVQAPGIYVGATNTSFDFYNQGTSYFNGTVTVDAAFTQSGGDASTFSGGVNITGTNNTTSTLTLTNTAPTPDNSWSLVPQYNSQDLQLLEDSTTRVTFGSGGNVGIGLTSPTAKLDVFGTINIASDGSTNHTNSRLILNSTQNAARGAGVFMHNTNDDQEWYAGVPYNDAFDSYVIGYQSTASHADSTSELANALLMVESGGNVGIGTTSLTNKLEVLGTSGSTSVARFKAQGATTDCIVNLESSRDCYLQFTAASTAKWALAADYPNTGDFDLYNYPNNFNSMTWKDDGNVGIGTTSPQNILHLKSNDPKLILEDGNAGSDEKVYAIYPAGSQYVLQTMTDAFAAGQNVYVVDRTGTAVDTHKWYTANSERMRITSGGEILIGTQTITSAGKLQLTSSNAYYGLVDRAQVSDSGNPAGFFNSAGSLVGYIGTNNSSTTYHTSSDYRLKEDLKEFNGLDIVSQIKTYDFKWKSYENRSYGVMAHELQEVIPDAVAGEKDLVNEDGSINPQGVDYSKIVPLLVKSIQELKAEIETLKTQINK